MQLPVIVDRFDLQFDIEFVEPVIEVIRAFGIGDRVDELGVLPSLGDEGLTFGPLGPVNVDGTYVVADLLNERRPTRRSGIPRRPCG